MLKLIDEFQRVASTFKLDSNSVEHFDSWLDFKSAAKTAGRDDSKIEEFNMFMEAKKLSDEAEKFIGDKVEYLMKEEGKTQDAALGQAYGMARDKGYTVPEPPKKGSVEKSAEPGEDHEDHAEEGEGILPESPGEEDVEEGLSSKAHALFEMWESGEISLRDMHHNLLEALGEGEEEEEAEDIIFGLVDSKIEELTGSDEEEPEPEEPEA